MLGLCDQFLYAPETFNVGTRTELRVSGIGLAVGVSEGSAWYGSRRQAESKH